MTTNIPRIFELNLSRLLVWVTALVRYFSMTFSYAQRGAGDSLGLSFFPSSIWNANLYAWEPHTDYQRGNEAAPPAGSPRSQLLPTHLLPPTLPVAHWPLPSPLGDSNGVVFADEKFLKLTRDLLPAPSGEGEPNQRGSAPGFPLCISMADPKCCQQHELLTPRVPLTAEGLLEGWEPFLKLKGFLNRSPKVKARHKLKNMETLLLWKYQQLT